MKKYFASIIALLAIGFTACNSSDKNNTSSSTIEDDNMHSNASEADVGADAALLHEVYSDYFALTEALANDDGKRAQTAAKNLHKAISEAPKDKMDAADQEHWSNYQRKLSYDAEHIMEINETPHQREHLVSLSKNMFEVMKQIKPSGTVYYQNCPMYANNKGGVWISENAQIKNPYFGEKMLDCGSTIDTIKN